MNKKVCMVGCVEAGYKIIETLLENKIKFDYFVSVHPKDKDKYAISGYKDFTDLAQKYNIPLYYVEKYNMKNEKDINFFKKHKFDLIILGGWQRLIPKEILDTLSIGLIGVHGSSNFLPRGRGRSPLNWSLIENKKRFITHLFIATPNADDGDIIDYEHFDINEFDTIKTLYYKISIVTTRMLLRNIPKLLKGEINRKPQTGNPTYYPKRTPEDGLIKWKEYDVDYIYNLIRAVTKPYPGAFTFYKGKKIFIWKAQIFDRVIKYEYAEYGQIVEVFDNDFIVNCLDGLLLVTGYEFEDSYTKNFIQNGVILDNE